MRVRPLGQFRRRESPVRPEECRHHLPDGRGRLGEQSLGVEGAEGVSEFVGADVPEVSRVAELVTRLRYLVRREDESVE